MWLLAIEALGAMFILVFIVWWTMFSGRRPEHEQRPTAKNDTEQK